MGTLIEFKKHGDQAIKIAREKQLKEGDKRRQGGFESSAEVQTAKEIIEREKLKRMGQLDFLGEETSDSDVLFSKNIEDADKAIKAKLGKKKA